MSPDGTRAVYSKGHNLWLKKLDSGEEKPLTRDGERYYAYATNPDAMGAPAIRPEAVWSPDSRYLFTAQTDDRQVKSLPVIDFRAGRRQHTAEGHRLPPGTARR